MRILPPRPALAALTVLMIAMLALALPSLAGAAVFAVTNAADTPLLQDCDATPAACSLREAVESSTNSPGADAIVIGPGFTTTLVNGVIVLDDADPLVISGGGATSIVSGGTTQRIFQVNAPADIEIRSLVLEDGAAAGDGGAIYQSGGTLRLLGATVRNSTATGAGVLGGGIASTGGTLELAALTGTPTTISGNAATGDDASGGGIYAIGSVLDISDSVIVNNSVSDGGGANSSNFGGGIYGDATTTSISTTEFDSNSVIGIDVGTGGGAWLAGVSGSTTLTDLDVHDNAAVADTARGGGIVIDSGTATISGGTFAGNAVTGNALSAVGGALQLGAQATITNVTISGNSVTSAAGIATGAGINVDGGDTTLRGSTLASNIATGFTDVRGGGVYAFGGTGLVVERSTFHANEVAGAGTRAGSAIWAENVPPAVTTISNATITANLGGVPAVQSPSGAAGPLTVSRSIMVDNVGGDCDEITSGGYNLVPVGGCTASTPEGTDVETATPQLGALASNGGPTQTMMPDPLSPAIDAAEAAPCALGTDQRGTARPLALRCDIGAVEAPAGSVSASPTSVAFGTVLVGSGTSAATTITFTNAGPGAAAGPASVSVTGTGAAQFVVSSNTCNGAILLATQSCTIGVQRLAATEGSFIASLVVPFPLGTINVPLSATTNPLIATCTDTAADAPLGASTAIPLTCSGTIDSVELLDQPAVGSGTVSGRTLTYVAPGATLGTETLRFRARNASGVSAPATLTITRIRARPLKISASLPSGMRSTSIARGTCGIDAGELDRCILTARVGRTVVARGVANVPLSQQRTSVPILVRATAAGKARAGSRVGGLRATWTMDVRTRDARRTTTGTLRLVPPKQAIRTPQISMFDGTDAKLTRAGKRFLASTAKELRGAPIARVTCTGHTATLDGGFGDMKLGIRRAKAACAELRRLGIRVRFSYASPGALKPRASNSNESGRALNRRVDLLVSYRG